MSDNRDWQQVAITMSDAGYSGREIALAVSKSKSTVNAFIRAYHEAKTLARVEEMYQDAPGIVRMMEYDNSRILIISDMHIPFHHPDLLTFLQMLKDRYNPTRVICIGDELDKHGLSFHDSDPDLPSAGDELRRALPIIAALHAMFPVIDFLDSNHGSMVYRKAKHHGIPRHYIRSYNDVLGVGPGWKWHNELVVELPNGQKVYFHHGKSSSGIKLSQAMGMSCVQGHFHETCAIQYWTRPGETLWSMQVGCLVDDHSLAMEYNKLNLKRPVIGTGLIIDSIPVIELMPE